MRVLVTGAAGFIGSHVAETLAARGDDVIGLDNLDPYYDPHRKRSNLKAIETGSAGTFRFVEGDVRDRALVDSLFSAHSFDAIAHLAAMAGVRVSLENPHLYLDVNVRGTLELLEATRSQDPMPNFVLASTSSVYGRTEQIPFVETDPSDRPLAPYPASKRAAEILGHTYHHVYGIDFTALRFFTVYGPRGRPDMMAFKVADNISTGAQTDLYNEGQMHRDWTYIDDIVAGVVAALDRRLGYEVINLGRGEPVLLADFVRLIEKGLGGTSELTPEEMPIADISYTYADVTKARKLLDYEPTISLQEGIDRFLDWYKTEVLGQPDEGKG